MTNLTQAERDALAQELLAQQASINAKLNALGLATKPKEPEKSPDGGPPSNIHQNPNFKTTLRKLIPVEIQTADGSWTDALISAGSFDSKIHRHPAGSKSDEEKKSGRTRRDLEDGKTTKVKLDPGKFGNQPRSELAALSMDVLAAMPEVGVMEEVPTDKGKMVDAILAVRGEFGAN